MVDTLVWITGASSGLGAALATTAPFDDARVVSISRSPGPDGTEHLPADLAEPVAWSAVETHLLARLTGFDGGHAVFVHNASTLDPIGFAGEVDSPAYRANVLLNSAAGQVLGHAFLKAVAESGFDGRAVLVMISSGAATSAYPGWSSYCAGKAALDQWVRAVGEEQRSRDTGVTVLSIAPGVVATAMQEQIRATDEADFPPVQRFHELHDSGRLRDPEDAARDLWAVLDRDLPSGSVTDLRS
ncbi:MAG: SDR family NAD(P)-dependent oxidoreductase [Nitriliruptorales bacterium]|nr:SDR family NAD(P)-dependent oxidoreductase [Nitriliruptorales bacterium]